MKETEQPLRNQATSALLALGGSSRESVLSGHDWGADDASAAADDYADDLGGRLASVGFIAAELRRRVKLWVGLALVGLALGVILSIALPASRQATTSILIGIPPATTPGNAMQDDQGLMQSRTVAAAALRSLGLRESPARFVSQYTTSVGTNQILLVTTKAPSGALAVREGNALAAAFVAFQTRLLQSQQQLEQNSLQAQVSQAQQALDALNSRISQLSAEPSSATQRTELASLLAQSGRDAAALTIFRQEVIRNEADTLVTVTTVVNDTRVLDAAVASPASAKKRLLLYGGGGLLAGLIVGMAIVIIGALTTGRLRRRDDVARALGAPVRLSVSRRALSAARTRSLAAHKDPAVQRIVAHLRDLLSSPGRDGPATLAVVPVDDPAIPALCLTSLAIVAARHGLRVVLADLCDSGPAARLLGAAGPGVHTVNIGDVRLTVSVPEGDPVTVAGPLARSAHESAAATRLAEACARADLLLTLVSLDPAVGSDYLPGWADRVVPMVTTGRSSAAHIYAVGEMIRLAGLRPLSAVLLDADDADESLGVVAAPEAAAAQEQPVQAADMLAHHTSPAAAPGP